MIEAWILSSGLNLHKNGLLEKGIQSGVHKEGGQAWAVSRGARMLYYVERESGLEG